MIDSVSEIANADARSTERSSNGIAPMATSTWTPLLAARSRVLCRSAKSRASPMPATKRRQECIDIEFLATESSYDRQVNIGSHAGLSPALNCDAADEAEWKSGRSYHLLHLERRGEDRIHRRVRAKIRCCSTKPEVARRSAATTFSGVAACRASDCARAVATSRWRSSASSIAVNATAPLSRCRSHARGYRPD